MRAERGILADFSRTCERCKHVKSVPWPVRGSYSQEKVIPGGFWLTLAMARKLAVQEFGTVKGLEPNCDVMDKYERQEKRAALERWVYDGGPEPCHKLIDEIWDKGE